MPDQSELNTPVENFERQIVRKYGREATFAIETTIRFHSSPLVQPDVQQRVWIGGSEISNATWFEFEEAAHQTASVAQFNGQRRWTRGFDSKQTFSMVWSEILGRDHPYVMGVLTAERLAPRLLPLVHSGYFCAAIGTQDYRLIFLRAKDEHFLIEATEVEMPLADFEVPLVETMKLFESVAILCGYEWREVLGCNYRSHW